MRERCKLRGADDEAPRRIDRTTPRPRLQDLPGEREQQENDFERTEDMVKTEEMIKVITQGTLCS